MPHNVAADTPAYDRPSTSSTPAGNGSDGYVTLLRERLERTPLNAYVALPGSVLHGPDEVLPPKWQLVGHLLSHDGDHPVLLLHVRDGVVQHADGRPLSEAAGRLLQAAWVSSRLSRKPRDELNAVLSEFPGVTAHQLALLVIRVPVCGGRTLGFGFALDGTLLATRLWDKSGSQSDRMHDALVRLYGGQSAREEATLTHQRRFWDLEAELPVPTTRSEAIRLAYERAIGKSLRESIPCRPSGCLLDQLDGDLLRIVQANLDLLWDDERGEATGHDPKHLHRYTGYDALDA